MTQRAAPVFRPAFTRWARRVRSQLALGLVLTGAAAGLVVGAGAAAVAWRTRHGSLRPWAATAGVLGAAAGLAVARRRRFSDEDVALYLDARLGSAETIATAIELDGARASSTADASPAREHVAEQAALALGKATAKAVRPHILRAPHLGAPAGAAAIAWLSLLPLPPAPPAPPPPPGIEQVRLASIQGLEKVIALEQLDARDAKQRERLKKLADDAKKLRDKLQKGVEKREALDDMTKLRDALTAERLSLGEGERAGLEAALGKLADHAETKDAAKELGDRDLEAFDEEMEKLANSVEKADRERAKKALDEAAEAAKKGGAPGVAKALEEQRQRMKERGKRADTLRELSKALGDALGKDGKQALEDFNRDRSPKAEQKLQDKLEEALKKLTPEQRKQLAENLKRQAEQMQGGDEDGPEPPTKKQLQDLAKELDTPEGQKALEKALKEMCKNPGDQGGEAERQKQLGEAQKGLGELGGQMGLPMPMPGGPAAGGKDGPDSGGKGDKEPEGQPGHTEGGGPGKHDGKTDVVAGKGVIARADARLNAGGKPVPGTALGRAAGRAGETANVQGSGALGAAAPSELGGIERSEVPEEYREQVGRYFQPK